MISSSSTKQEFTWSHSIWSRLLVKDWCSVFCSSSRSKTWDSHSLASASIKVVEGTSCEHMVGCVWVGPPKAATVAKLLLPESVDSNSAVLAARWWLVDGKAWVLTWKAPHTWVRYHHRHQSPHLFGLSAKKLRMRAFHWKDRSDQAENIFVEKEFGMSAFWKDRKRREQSISVNKTEFLDCLSKTLTWGADVSQRHGRAAPASQRHERFCPTRLVLPHSQQGMQPFLDYEATFVW